jgi:hypothetical protein
MYQQTDTTLTSGERISRSVVGMAFIVAVLSSASAPVWLALVAAYFCLTAIMATDPLYLALDRSVRAAPNPPVVRHSTAT